MQKLTNLALLGLVVTLAGCGNLGDSLGFGRNSPDEFAVVDRPPLSLPPDFDLRPPRPGAPRPQEVSMKAKAATTLFGGASSGASEGKSEGEAALLSAAGVAKADSNIRETLDREASQRAIGSDKLVDEILWWRSKDADATTVDAAAEAQRLRELKEKGEAPSDGKTPVISKGKSGWLGLE